MPSTPREPSPPPKPDSTECHRSQSAIFTRNWNRGEGNSCARTDLYFKPVPDSKLARYYNNIFTRNIDLNKTNLKKPDSAGNEKKDSGGPMRIGNR